MSLNFIHKILCQSKRSRILLLSYVLLWQFCLIFAHLYEHTPGSLKNYPVTGSYLSEAAEPFPFEGIKTRQKEKTSGSETSSIQQLAEIKFLFSLTVDVKEKNLTSIIGKSECIVYNEPFSEKSKPRSPPFILS